MNNAWIKGFLILSGTTLACFLVSTFIETPAEYLALEREMHLGQLHGFKSTQTYYQSGEKICNSQGSPQVYPDITVVLCVEDNGSMNQAFVADDVLVKYSN